MTKTFAADLRASDQVTGELLEHELKLLVRARDNLYARRAERDLLLADLLVAYRAGPRNLWAPLILDQLAPGMIQLLGLLRPQPPLMSEDDIRQQLVLEVLRAAGRIPIRDGFDLKVRLLARAYRYVVRWLAREGLRQSQQCSYGELRKLVR